MRDFFAYISTHWYVGLILLILLVAAVLMWIKAVSSSQKNRAEREAIIAKLEKEKALRNEFRNLTENSFNIDDNEKLLFGIGANIQMFLEKQEDMNKAFDDMPEVKKFVYALNYIFEDAQDSELSKFFKANGQPLTGEAEKAVKGIIGGKFSEIFTSLYNMTDDDVDDVSYDPKKIEEYDKAYAEIMSEQKAEIFSKIAQYIKTNKSIFLS